MLVKAFSFFTLLDLHSSLFTKETSIDSGSKGSVFHSRNTEKVSEVTARLMTLELMHLNSQKCCLLSYFLKMSFTVMSNLKLCSQLGNSEV